MDDQDHISADNGLGPALQRYLVARTGGPVALRETHISWVLLTSRLVFKLKKPVRLPFLDFSRRELRRHFCEEELRLNRRLAPSLYLGVVPVCGTPQQPRLDGKGDPIDHAVCMRRFSDDALLKDRLATGRLEPYLIDRLAQRIAAFHLQASRADTERREDGLEEALKPVRSVLVQLSAGAEQAQGLARLQQWIEARGHELREEWASRRRVGAIRECHGDLHLGNTIALGDDATAFDCIEFDPSLRWIDVMSDVAFLVMDLKAHDRRDLAFRFLDGYLQDSGDYEGLRVLRYYEVYRALVRALVVRLSPAASAPDYLRCAEHSAAGEGASPRLLITSGPSGSGKSTIARQLLQHAGAIRIRSDVERKRLFGLGASESSLAAGIDIYTADATARTFARLTDLARVALQAGYPVIVDAAFLRRAERQTFRELAQRLDVPFTILRLSASEATLAARVARRGALGEDASEADVAVLQRQLREWSEPLDDVERRLSIEVDTDLPTDLAGLANRWSSIPRPGC